jgi:hypothetical protein
VQIRNLKYFATLSLGIALTVWVAGCGCNVNCVAQASIALAGSLEANSGSEPSDATTIADPPECTSFQPSPSTEDALMFIDITQSMAGFTAGAVYREFDEVMDDVSGALGLSRVVEFGRKGAALFTEGAVVRSLHSEAAYSGLNNPDYCLFDFALNWDGDKPIIYLTDGVQSAKSISASGPSVAALTKWLERGHHVGIMAFRGKFSGRLWSERAQDWIGPVREDSETRRPFYLFVLASDEAELEDVFEQLDSTLRQDGAALKPQYGTSLTTVQFGERERTCNLTTTIPYFTNDPPSRWTWVEDLKIATFAVTDTTEIARWECDELVNAPSDPSVRRGGSVEFTYREWDRAASAFGDPIGNPLGAAFSFQRGTLTGKIGNDPLIQPYTFWALEISGERGPMRPDLRALSTFSDATLDAADKTYRFDSLIENLAAADFEHQRPTATVYLTVKGF